MALSDRIVVMNKGRVEQIGRAARGLRAAGDRVRRAVSRQDQRAFGPATYRRRTVALVVG